MSVRFGAFELVERLGGGELAETWLAKAARFRRPVVIKRLLPHLAARSELRRAFLSEAQWLALAVHPSVVRVLSVEEVDGAPVLVMEHVKGGTLEALYRERFAAGGVSPGLVAYVAARVCEGLAHLHAGDAAAGTPPLVHRDVSASNVMLGEGGEVKLIDFGIARPLGVTAAGTRTGAGLIKGKQGFVAPERLDGDPGTPACDVFSVGVVIYLGLTGRRPFGDGDFRAPPEPPSRTREVPAALERECLRALALAPAERPTAAALARSLDAVARAAGAGTRELSAALAELLSAEPSETRTVPERPMPRPEAARPKRKPMLAVALVVAGALVLAAAFAIALRRSSSSSAPPVSAAVAPPPAPAIAAPPPAPAIAAPPPAPAIAAPTSAEKTTPARTTSTSRATAAPPTATGARPPRHHATRHARHVDPVADPFVNKGIVDPFP
jgi:serine/threonine-protein kinase